MPALRLVAAALALFSVGCATSSAPAPVTPLPDARELSEDPLDVINLPQP